MGIDTITFCAVGQSAAVGSGTTLIKGVMGDASNLVTTTGATALELTTGGAGTLNAGDSGITAKLDAASNLGPATASFITAIGAAAGKDRMTAGGANQTLQSIGGSDTLVASANYGDTFTGTANGLNGDVIQAFGGSDRNNFTDLMLSSFKSLG